MVSLVSVLLGLIGKLCLPLRNCEGVMFYVGDLVRRKTEHQLRLWNESLTRVGLEPYAPLTIARILDDKDVLFTVTTLGYWNLSLFDPAFALNTNLEDYT
jgi:hypothetical protein